MKCFLLSSRVKPFNFWRELGWGVIWVIKPRHNLFLNLFMHEQFSSQYICMHDIFPVCNIMPSDSLKVSEFFSGSGQVPEIFVNKYSCRNLPFFKITQPLLKSLMVRPLHQHQEPK